MADRASSAGKFGFILDDKYQESAYIRTVGGGVAKGSVLREGVGSDELQIKHLGGVEIEPFDVEMGMGVSRPILEWIQESWNHEFSRRNGAIVYAGDHYKESIEHTFTHALLTEVKLPEVDALKSESPFMTLSFLPEQIEIKRAGGANLMVGRMPAEHKDWASRNFRFRIDGLESACKRVSKVGSFSVKQKLAKLYFGSRRYPEIEPTGLEFDDLTVTLPLEFADPFIKWYDEFVIKGAKDTREERQGELTFLGPQGGDLMTINFANVGINKLMVEKGDTGSAKAKNIVVTLHVEAATLELGPGVK